MVAVNHLPEDQRDNEHKGADADYPSQLRHQQTGAAAEEQTVARGVGRELGLSKQTDAQSAEHSVDQMH